MRFLSLVRETGRTKAFHFERHPFVLNGADTSAPDYARSELNWRAACTLWGWRCRGNGLCRIYRKGDRKPLEDGEPLLRNRLIGKPPRREVTEVLRDLKRRGRFFDEMFPGAKASDAWQRQVISTEGEMAPGSRRSQSEAAGRIGILQVT